MRSLSILFTLPLIACGGDDDGGGGGIKVPDASMQQQIDAPMQASCAAMPDYATPTPMQTGALRFCATQTALVKCPAATTMGTTGTAVDPVMVVYVAQLNAANDFFQVELWKTGNTPIAAAPNVNLSDATQSQWKSCTVCAYVSAQVNLQSGADMGTYLANMGTANITTVTHNATAANTKIAGAVMGLTMQHIDIAMDGTSTPSADACTTKLTMLAFDRAMTDPMMQFTGDKLEAIEGYVLNKLNAKYARR